MRLTLAETKYLKESVNILSELVTETQFKVTQDAIQVIAMDPANVAMVIYKLLSSSFVEFDVKEDVVLAINLASFKQVLRRVKPADTLTLETDANKLKITLKGTSTRTFHLPIIDTEEKQQKIPDLKFGATITTESQVFVDAVDDVDIIGESVSFIAEANTFTVASSGDLSKANVEIPADSTTKIVADQKQKSKYSIEYLKKMTAGSKLADKVSINFSNDYPLRLEYTVLNKLQLAFILAPRVDND